MKKSTFLNTRNWYIVSNACVSEFLPLAVLALMLSESHTLPCMSCFVTCCFMARGQSPITIVSFFSFELILSAVCSITPTRLWQIKFRPSSVACQVIWLSFHWNYIFISKFSYWKARQLASKTVFALSEQNISQASYFKNSLFRIKQLTILFAAQEVLYWFWVIHFDITMQYNRSNYNSIVLIHSDFASIFITPPSLLDSTPQTQLCS